MVNIHTSRVHTNCIVKIIPSLQSIVLTPIEKYIIQITLGSNILSYSLVSHIFLQYAKFRINISRRSFNIRHPPSTSKTTIPPLIINSPYYCGS